MSVSVLPPVIAVAFLLVTLLFTVGLSALIAWLVWRAAKKPVDVPPVPPAVPTAATTPSNSSDERIGGYWAGVGTVLLAVSFLCWLAVLPRVLMSFPRVVATVEQTGDGEEVAVNLASALHGAMLPAAIGGVLEMLGLVCLCVALLGYRYRAKWFFGVTIAAAVYLLPSFCLGTVAGVFLLVYVIKRRAEFFAEQSKPATPPVPSPNRLPFNVPPGGMTSVSR